MARRRMIDPNFWQSEDISKLSIRQRLLVVGLFSNADDEGKGRANIPYIRSIVFPYDDIPVKELAQDLIIIAEIVSICLYEVEGNSYYKFTNWEKWQRVDKPQQSLLPDIPESFQSNSGIIPESFLPKGKERKGKEKNISVFLDVINYLNDKAGTGYKPDTKLLCNISMPDYPKVTLDDFKKVIDKKCAEWKGTDQEKYLRPETLFGNKFEGYLNQKVISKAKPPTKAREPKRDTISRLCT